MTPQEKAQFQKMQSDLAEAMEFIRSRKGQQLVAPLDIITRALIQEDLIVGSGDVASAVNSSDRFAFVTYKNKRYKLLLKSV